MDETLLETVAVATGLPRELVLNRLKELILSSGRSPQDLTLEDLREALVPLLQSLFVEVAAGENEFIKLSG